MTMVEVLFNCVKIPIGFIILAVFRYMVLWCQIHSLCVQHLTT